MMKKNITNWYKIENWQELSIQYKLVTVSLQGDVENEKELNIAFNQVIKFLSSETKGVVATTIHKGKKYIAVPAKANLSAVTIPGNPLDIKLTPVEGIHTLMAKTVSDDNLQMAVKFIDSAIKFQINRKNKFWDAGLNTFLNKTPIRMSTDMDTDIYQGFKFRVIALNWREIFICLDLAYRYVAKYTLSDILKNYPKERWAELIYNKNFLYQNGDDWYTVKGRSVGGALNKEPLDKDGYSGTVYEYMISQGKYASAQNPQPLPPDSATFFHSNANKDSKQVAGAACLARSIHKSESGLHKYSINEPYRRFNGTELFIGKYFQKLVFAGQGLRVSDKSYTISCNVFKIPALKYANNRILDPYHVPASYMSPLQDFPKRRREYILKNGLLNDEPFLSQYIFYADTTGYAFAKSIKEQYDSAMKQLDSSFLGFILKEYKVGEFPFAHKTCKTFKKMIQDRNLAGSYGLFILPEMEDDGRYSQYLHRLLKKELFEDVKLKCISEKSLKKFFKPNMHASKELIYTVPDGLVRRHKAYQNNTLFEYLIVNRKWPYALAKNLNYDLYIGIDAHEFYAGFCFFFKNGERIIFDVEKTAKSTGSIRQEKINHAVIKDKIVEVLTRHIHAGEEVPGSVVILRDGRSYGEEGMALEAALNELHAEGLMNKLQTLTGVLDVAKSTSIPVRAADINGKTLANPDCGTCISLNKNDAFIFNTGYPYEVQGSSNPLHVSFAEGNIDFNTSLEDVFNLTQISFSAPDLPSSLPLPLKLIDILIRDVAHEYDMTYVQDIETKLFTGKQGR